MNDEPMVDVHGAMVPAHATSQGVKTGVMHFSAMAKCPKLSMLPEHFREDGTCNCEHKDEIDAQLKALNIERKRLRAEHKKIVRQIDHLRRTK